MVLTPVTVSSDAQQAEGAPTAAPTANGSARELRLALGMRGGVSLAVWIGGACAEIDQLRRAPSPPATSMTNRPFWAGLTSATGYDSVLVDVMAGASAGGLNGVLFAACQVYGVPFDAIRATWLNVGSTAQLVRTRETERECQPDLRWLSLFRGDGHMFRVIVDALTSLIDDVDEQQRPRQSPRVDLRLSATHVEPILRPVRSPVDEQLYERRFGTGFRFRSSEQRWLGTDFPAYAAPHQPGRDAFAGHINRLALAARATSSYPGAFEAASVRSSRPPSFASGDQLPQAEVGADMAGVFADRSVEGTFVVADGGIVDNIPLRRALDAVAAAPASGPTDRYLIYLHPGAPTAATSAPTGPAPTEQRRRSVASVLRATAGAKVIGEDISGDIAAIDDHNRLVERAAAVRRATFEGLTDRGRFMSSAFDARLSYLTQRAGEDTLLVKRLLDDPCGFLGDDPFPCRVGGARVDESRWRSPLAGFTLAQLNRLDDAMYAHMAARLAAWRGPTTGLDGSVFATGALPLMRLTQTLLEWARHVERHDPAVGGAVKQVLYRVLAFCEAGIERPRRMAWVALMATAPRDSDDMTPVISTAIRHLEPLTKRSVEEVTSLCDALVESGDGPLVDLLEQIHGTIDETVGTAWSSTTPAGAGRTMVDLRRAVVEQVLVAQAEFLRSADAPLTTESETPTAGEYLHRVLGGDEVITVETLAALEVACYPEYATGTPGRRPIEFVRLSAANPTPLAAQFTALEADARRWGRWWEPDNQDWAQQRGIHVELKLAGNELANFSAFLRDDWRANDWMWGRLDAVPTLIDLVVTPASITRGIPLRSARVAAIRQLVTDSDDAEINAIGRELWDAHGLAIEAELDSIGGATPATLNQTRLALVARRQWEILAEELPGDGPLRERVMGYRAGAERITDRQFRDEIRERLREIVDAGSQVLLATASAHGITRYGTPDRPTWRGRVVRFAFRCGGRFTIRRAIK